MVQWLSLGVLNKQSSSQLMYLWTYPTKVETDKHLEQNDCPNMLETLYRLQFEKMIWD